MTRIVFGKDDAITSNRFFGQTPIKQNAILQGARLSRKENPRDGAH